MLKGSPLKVRQLGLAGVITDIEPADLPYNAFSGGMNIRFTPGGVVRAPAFRLVNRTSSPYVAVACHTIAAESADRFLVIQDNGDALIWRPSSAIPITQPGITLAVDPLRPTICSLQGLTYVNRPSALPRKISDTGTSLDLLTHWDANWRARVLRDYRGLLVALNVTKSGIRYPNMVKWSEFAELGAEPISWDHTDPTTNAGENELKELRDQIVDGLSLADNFVIYTENEAFLMRLTLGTFLMDFTRLGDFGVMTTGCVQEIDGKHFVFGPNDLYVHQGIPGATPASIADGKVRRHVFENVDFSRKDKCFVANMPRYSEVWFCFPSKSPWCTFKDTAYCNMAAVYSLTTGAWSFRDLPNVSAATLAHFAVGEDASTWDTTPVETTWDSDGGPWEDPASSRQRSPTWLAMPVPGSDHDAFKVLQSDGAEWDSRLPFPVDNSTNISSWAERVSIDLDEGLDWRSSKVVRAVIPQVQIATTPIKVRVGYQFVPQMDPTYSPQAEFDPRTAYTVDCFQTGRWLAVRWEMGGYRDFRLSGFDVMVTPLGGL
jgi:hypothetical protein